MDTRYLLVRSGSIHLSASRLAATLPTTEPASQRLQELMTASSSPELWTAYLTALEYGPRNWPSPNAVFEPRMQTSRFRSALTRNARQLGVEASPDELISGIVAAFGESGIVLSTADIECVEECYKRYEPDSDNLLRCLEGCVSR